MNAVDSRTIRPGLLVSLKTSVRGNVEYKKKALDADGAELPPLPEGVKDTRDIHRWETTRIITDPAEHNRASKVREQAGRLIRTVCTQSAFGLLCPESASDELTKAVAAAAKLCDDFNSTAQLTRVGVYVIAGKIASDDVQAAKAIGSEVRDMLALLEQGLKNLDVKAIRDAASKAKAMGNMLSPEKQAQVMIAVEKARKAATNIANAAEVAAVTVDQRAVAAVTDARTAFLDLDGGDTQVQAPKAQGRAVDFAPAELPSGMPKRTRQRRLDLEG